ncbi:MAG: sulfatase-like hydrolase/transferase [Verrucomicrobia bacterium]|nr:sulfatase-like hydrolase/transferase [Verrucomicrobiota bacterium]MCH8527121.1 sulfatase-like hydrolase/transferase [Kiritimatiellia bacterium]
MNSQTPSPSKPPPNILVFFVDQQRWDTLGLNGYPAGLTPNFDRLARQGTFFKQAVTPQPVCGPARSCIQTGQYATTTGVWKNGPGLKPDAPKLAECFNRAGYHTAYFGKWHLSGDSDETAPVQEANRGGYRHWLGANCVELTSGPYSARLWDNENNEVNLPGYRVDAQTDVMLDYLHDRAKDKQPFLCFHSYLEPHHQNSHDNYPAPNGYEDLYRYAPLPPDLQALGGSAPQHWPGYCGMIKRLDEALGRTMDLLESTGLAENTVVVYLSDHGCHFKTRNAEYKRSPHESSVRIPLAFWGPGWNGGGERNEAASLVDLMPTLLDTAGIEMPAAVQGRSLCALRGGAPADWPEDTLIQFGDAWLPPGRALRTNRWKYAVTAREADARKAAAEQYRETHLYDLHSDPYELNNLAGRASHRELSDRLAKRLSDRMAEAGEPPATILPAEETCAGQTLVEYPG